MIGKLLIVILSLGLCAQSPKALIRQDKFKTAGSFYVYDYAEAPVLTPAPEGFRPFYISHFARHGARYCTSEYDSVYGWFSKAAREDLLTDEGRDFFSRYESYYRKVRYCKGNLTDIGKAQHRAVAGHMFIRFPEVFEGPTRVEAVSTESPRVIMSMWSCLSELQALDSDLEIDADASASFAPWLQPSLSSNPYLVKNAFKPGKEADEAVTDYILKTVHWEKISGKFFVSPDVPEKNLGTTPEKFLGALFGVVVCTRCLDEDRGCFDDVFSDEEQFRLWKALSARYFLNTANFQGSECLAVDYAAFTLGQIIESAEEDIASGRNRLRLRFGHDSGLAPLLAFLDVNGFGRVAGSFGENMKIFPDYNIPMGASLQMVFYRNQEGQILIRVLLNEAEASLPLDPVHGCFFRWTDFKEHYLPLIEISKGKISALL